jgi:hypothetical protein
VKRELTLEQSKIATTAGETKLENSAPQGSADPQGRVETRSRAICIRDHSEGGQSEVLALLNPGIGCGPVKVVLLPKKRTPNAVKRWPDDLWDIFVITDWHVIKLYGKELNFKEK